jgi:hypothetical protein
MQFKKREPSKTFNSNLHFSSISAEWYTPQKIIEPTVRLLGQIDLDPCSNSRFHPNIPALKHYVQDDDGLNQTWYGRLYLNPPYGRGIINWIEKLVYHYDTGDLTQAVSLLPARTDTQWFSLLKPYVRCFIRGRLRFSQKGAAPFPSVVVYLGAHNIRFKECFEHLGDLYRPMY